MHENEVREGRRRRTARGERGQVGVETAIVMPMTIFLILGILQLSMMQQARLLTEYAAYRAVRAGALLGAGASSTDVWCQQMNAAAIEGLLPSLGRADSAGAILNTWAFGSGNGVTIPNQNYGDLMADVRIVHLFYAVNTQNGGPNDPYSKSSSGNQTVDFDDPDHPITLTVDVVYNYELRIPFADYMIHQMWTGMNYFSDTVDQLVPASNYAANDTATMDLRMRQFNTDKSTLKNQSAGKDLTNALLVAAQMSPPHYFVPIRSAYSMRMMANLPSGVDINAGKGSGGVECATSMPPLTSSL